MSGSPFSLSLRRGWMVLGFCFLPVLVPGCGENPGGVQAASPAVANPGAAADFTYYTAEVVQRFPHDPHAFTQGLLFESPEVLIEGTGLHGQSSLRRVEARTGRVLRKVDLPRQFFGEGIALLNGKIFQLTWKQQTGLIYDAGSLEKVGEFRYTGEGWGLTTDGKSLILSDGSAALRFLDPSTFQVVRTIQVTHEGRAVDRLNELEFVDGAILANIWGADLITRIDPETGRSTGVIDCRGIFPAATRDSTEQVLNGIAWDPVNRRLFLTGKLWPAVYEVTLKAR